MTRLDIVVAVYNEEACIPAFVEAVRALDLPESLTVRILFVEDSSTDNTVSILRRLSKELDFVEFCSLSKGFGQSAALFYGLTLCEGDAVITMDVDDGHPVALIPELVKRHLGGAEIVQAVRKDIEGRPAYRDVGTRLFVGCVKLLTGVDLTKQNVHYRLVGRDVKVRILSQRRWIHFLRFNFPASDRPMTDYVEFESPKREMGQSKYGFGRLLVLSLKGILSLVPPGRFFLSLATAVCLSSALGWYAARWLAVVLLAALATLVGWYFRIVRNRIVESMNIKESSLTAHEKNGGDDSDE